MIPFKRDDKTVLIPSNWGELTVKQFLEVKQKESFFDKLEVITGENGWEKIKDFDFNLLPFVLWLTEEIDYEPENYLSIKGQYKPIIYALSKDLGEYTFGQKIICQHILSDLQEAKKDFTDSIADLISTYYQPIVNEEKYSPESAESFKKTVLYLKLSTAYPTYLFILKELLRLIERDSIYLVRNQKPQEALAGSKELSRFKDLLVIDSLANGDIFKHDAVTEMSYNRVFGKLYMENEKEKYKERLEKVYKQKQTA